MKTTLKVLLLTVFALALFAESASAIPAFARKYRMSCSTCHYPFPRLKAYGDDFAGNGFVLEDEEAPRYYVDTGDEDLSLVRELPFAIRFDSWMFYDEGAEAIDFKTPWTIKLLSGGSLSDHVSYYFYFYFDEHGEVAGIDDAFLLFNNIIPGHDFDVYFGQFSISDPMMKSELRLEFENYAAYRTYLGDSSVRLSYDRGLMATYGMPWGSTGLTAMVVNGNGIGEFDNGIADNDDGKVIAGHLSQDIGEIASVGVLGLTGLESWTYQAQGQLPAMSVDNDVLYWGVNGTVEFGPLQLNGQYLRREDEQELSSLGNSTSLNYAMDGWIGELIFWPNGDASKFYGALLYNDVWAEWEFPSASPSQPYKTSWAELPDHRVQTFTAHVGHMARRNVRVALEGTYDMEAEQFKAGIGVVAAW